MVFYCPICWSEISKEEQSCQHCRADLVTADGRPMVEKLCAALRHPEPETAMRAAWILGERREEVAVPELIRILETTQDGFLAEAAAEALGKIRDSRAKAALEHASVNGPLRVRNAAKVALQRLR